MKIEIKKSTKPVEYKEAIDFLEKRLVQINHKKETELIWILEHPSIYTAGTSYNENEILDKSINVIKTNRGGKITYHGPGQTICYFVIDLNKRKKDIRKFTTTIENIIIQTLKEYQISAVNSAENVEKYLDEDNTPCVAPNLQKLGHERWSHKLIDQYLLDVVAEKQGTGSQRKLPLTFEKVEKSLKHSASRQIEASRT